VRSLSALATVLALAVCAAAADVDVEAGFAAVEITPEVGGQQPVFMAGYGMNRKATGVHDAIMARTVVLASGGKKIALVSADLVGLQYPTVQAIRKKLPQIDYVLVCSTHNHEGPDVIGIWGRGPLQRGVDDDYLERITDKIAASIKVAAAQLAPVVASYGMADDDTLLADLRLPNAKDGVLRAVQLAGRGTGKPAGLIVQWNCHPESLGSKNTLLSADFPAATVAALEKKYGCPVVYVSGAVGGLMSLPSGRIFDDKHRVLGEGSYEFARRYGEEVAALATKALDAAQPLTLAPIMVSTRTISVPVHNALYRAARAIGVLKREGHVWTGDFQSFGEPMKADRGGTESAVASEVAYVRLGELHLACVPGELYPELVYGKFQDPVETGADFPDAPLEPAIAKLMPGPKWLLIGLANDELGYIIPKRQWDKQPPYAYGVDGGQYGEINSCGPEVAPIIMEALRRRITEAGQVAPAQAGGK
jgi:hypothetical protein